ncbi:MAG: aminopeptidase [Flavobacteriales bacterium]|nr:aminopeptidase [Flavobacteriales bacterium]MCX7767622.1 aminopeptidase [Flavobacteriales bacterium]MDW8409536.1 aminopeptidase [Flavobacteriales bacterium]
MFKLLAKDILVGAFLIGAWRAGESIIYTWHLAKGYAIMMFRSRPVESVLTDPATPDSLKKRLLLAQEIRRYAQDSLGLKNTRAYTRFYEHSEGILYVLTASEKYRLKPYLWRFPIAGCVSYKAFLDPIMARREWERLLAAGYDVRLRIVDAWSTLGLFPDPLTTGLLRQDEGFLANVMFHEMFHTTLYIPDNTELSEGLATVMGNAGALLYLRQKYGSESDPYIQHLKALQEAQRVDQYLLHCAERLDSLYSSPFFQALDTMQKDSAKAAFFALLSAECFSRDTSWRPPCQSAARVLRTPNNANLVIARQYHSEQLRRDTLFATPAAFRAYLRQLVDTYGR